ncbi:MAG: hypothetical protein IK006_04285 [Bacteroidaceae bacterium]|nr:hypothetical protein [Bacteroidaceae bacterium]
MRFLGISRAEQYSPNRMEGDAAVFRAVGAELERNGSMLICMTEEEIVHKGIPQGIDGIFQMARSREALAVLGQAYVPVTNTVQAVLNCGRASQTRILLDAGLIPESMICSTAAVPAVWDSYPCWIKRADSHAVEQDDVQFVQDAPGCAAGIRGFAERGIKECVLQNHVRGWLIKFYGVRGFGLTDYSAATVKEGKFGLERFNDVPGSAHVDVENLTSAAERVSELLGVEIYGGDAVVSPEGKVTVVDVNDWPSFSSCALRAAPKIAELIMSKSR